MDEKLENLIEKIEKEAVEEAQQTAGEIVGRARQEAESIIAAARREAEEIAADGRRRAEVFRQNAELALRQAARDTQLSLKERIVELFDRVFQREVSRTLTPDFLKELILKVVSAWTPDAKVEIVLNDADKDGLQTLLLSGLGEEFKNSVSLSANSDISGGFRIGLNGEHVYYDFSDGSIADALKAYVNPDLRKILDTGDG